MPYLCGAGSGTQGFLHAAQALYQLDSILSPDPIFIVQFALCSGRNERIRQCAVPPQSEGQKRREESGGNMFPAGLLVRERQLARSKACDTL